MLDQLGYDIELEDLRQHSTTFSFTQVSEDSFSNSFWPANHSLAGEPIKLRPHQVEMINCFLHNPQSLINAATGAGKTLVIAALSHRVQKYGRSIVIVPNTDLVQQTYKDYVNLGLDVGVYYGKEKNIHSQHVICTWQSLNSSKKKNDLEELLKDVVCVIVDEVHGLKAQALKELLSTSMANVPIRWGLTGTIPKHPTDQMSLLVCIGKVVHTLAAVELQDKGLLSKLQIDILQMQDDKDFKTYQSELSFLVGDEDRIKYISKLIARQISITGNTLVLVDRIKAGKLIQESIEELNNTGGPFCDSVFISGETDNKSRSSEYSEMIAGTNKVIIATYGIAAVGINIVEINNLVLIEPGKSFVRVIQSIGRGLRVSKDKNFVMIYDITSNCKFAKRHMRERKQYYEHSKYPYQISKISYR
jgi:superfamily II DNA or RNA helicase